MTFAVDDTDNGAARKRLDPVILRLRLTERAEWAQRNRNEFVRGTTSMQKMLGGLVLVLLSTAAQAALTTDTASALYANTLVVRDQGTGSIGILQVNSDHTYTAQVTQNGRPIVVSGVWTLMADGSTVCLTPTSVGTGSSSLTAGCVPLAGHNVGDRWLTANTLSQGLDVSLKQGR